MSKDAAADRPTILRLIWIPSLISLGVTLLRLIGELLHWSGKWFSSETMGIKPSGVSWLIGITWLAIPFGAYFAWKLAAAGQVPDSLGKAFACVGAGVLLIFAQPYWLSLVPVGFPYYLVFIWAGMAIVGIIQMYAWHELFNTLLTYALAARIPVVIIMILAMRGNWRTHYDFVGVPPAEQMPLVPRVLWLAVFPQLVFWVAFTIFLGMLAGVVTFSIVRKRQPTRQAARA